MLLAVLAVLFAEEAVAQATTTANASLVISVCTIVIVPTITLLVQKHFESKRLALESMLQKAKLDAETAIATAKLELDSKLLVIKEQHAECIENHRKVEQKLEECEKQHEHSAQQHDASTKDRQAMKERLEKFEAVFARSAARDRAQATKNGNNPSG